MMVFRSAGQSLSEYGLAIGLVVLTAIGSLVFLSGNVNAMLAGAIGSVFKSSVAVAGASTGGTGGTSVPAIQVPAGVATQSVILTLQNGQTIALNQYPADLGQTVETSGANGATELLLANLEQLTTQLSQDPATSPELLSLLAKLANAGHAQARAEQIIQQVMTDPASATRPPAEILSTVYNVDGQAISFRDLLINVRSLIPVEDMYETIKADPNLLRTEPRFQTGFFDGQPRAVYDELMNALGSETLDDPALRSVVLDLTAKILTIGEAYAQQSWNQLHEPDPVKGGDRPRDTMLSSNDPLHETAASLTHLNSADICTTGNGKDSGIQCQ